MKFHLLAWPFVCLGCFALLAHAQEEPEAEASSGRAYLLKLSEKYQELEKTAEKAKKELIAALEDEKTSARKRGDLETAVALSDWIEELTSTKREPVERATDDTPVTLDESKTVSPLQGRYSFRYSNGITRIYHFGRDNTVMFLLDGSTANAEPVKMPVAWHREKDKLVGYIFWDDRKIHQIERVVVGKEGFIHVGHWSTNGVLTAEATKIK